MIYRRLDIACINLLLNCKLNYTIRFCIALCDLDPYRIWFFCCLIGENWLNLLRDNFFDLS